MRKVFCETLSKSLSLPDTTERIISFSPAVTETLFLLGLGDSVGGVSAFCARPEEARKKTKVGSYNTADIEFLKKLRPDLIFTVTGYQRDFALRLSNEFPVFAVELPVSVAGIIDMVVKIGLVSGAHEDARGLASKLLGSLAQLSSLPKPLKVYVEIDFTEPVTFGAYSYITDALSLLGAKGIFANKPMEWLTPELGIIPEIDPDVVIYEAKMFRRFSFDDLKALIKERGWDSMRAVTLGNLFLTPGPLDFLAHHGPSFISEAMPWLRKHLHDASRKLD